MTNKPMSSVSAPDLADKLNAKQSTLGIKPLAYVE